MRRNVHSCKVVWEILGRRNVHSCKFVWWSLVLHNVHSCKVIWESLGRLNVQSYTLVWYSLVFRNQLQAGLGEFSTGFPLVWESAIIANSPSLLGKQ